MSKIKLIAIDMDGTLLNNKHEVTPYTLEVLKRAIEKGIYVVLSTGRGLSRISIHEELMALKQPIIATNGADIHYEAGDAGEKSYLTKDSMKQLFAVINEVGIPFWGFSEELMFENRQLTEDELATCLKLGVQTTDLELLQRFYDKAKSIKDIEVTKSATTNFEINKAGISKAYGLQKLCDYLNFTLEEVMCFGDSANDLKMFEAVGFPVAVENAIPQLKEIAHAITLSNDDEGVAKAIEKFVLAD